MPEKILGAHGGYRQLKSFQLARLVYDLTVDFCNNHVSRFSRTRDQMIQAARSGVQNIAEGSLAAAASTKTEIRLTQVARASLEELKLDYEDFLRQNELEPWPRNHLFRQTLIDRRYRHSRDVLDWIAEITEKTAQHGLTSPPVALTYANAVLTLIHVACFLLDRQVAALARRFEREGGFSERLYRIRREKRRG